jgi:Holliday junction resolvase RusA-like endonuclease
MVPTKITFIDIHPATSVRSTRNESWLLAKNVTEEYVRSLDQKRLEETGKKGTYESVKRQLEKCWAHKMEIRGWVIRNGYKMPHGHVAIWFYVAMPPSWRKKKCAEMIYTVHQSTPDLDNFIKQLYDSIMPRKNKQKGEKGIDDRKVYNYSAFKVWVPYEEAGMKIVEYDAAEYMEAFKHGHPGYID